VSRGVRFSTEMQTWIYQAHRLADISESRVILRMLQIAREDLAAFDDAGLKRILREPWQMAKNLPALARPIQRRSHSRLSVVTATRLTVADMHAFREVAKKHRTTLAGIQRQLVEGTIAKEAD